MATTNDDPDGQSANGSGPATDEPPRTVAEEAALLVDLLSRRGWGAGGGMPSASSHAAAHEAGEHSSGAHAAVGDDPAVGHDDGSATGADPRPGGSPPGGSPVGEGRPAPECTCGGRQPAACKVCPVCQLISFVQQVNPDTIERVADFVGFAATALRDLASAQRERAEPSERSEPRNGTDPTQTRAQTRTQTQTDPQPTERPEPADDAAEGPA